jgi:hypothetical protein
MSVFHHASTRDSPLHYTVPPHTAMRVVNFSSLDPSVDREMFSFEPLETIQFPVVFTGGRRKASGMIMDLKRLLKWWRRRGTDPITKATMDWKSYQAVRWEDSPSNLHTKYNFYATNKILKVLKQGSMMAIMPSNSHRQDDDQEVVVNPLLQYVLFRSFMSEVAAGIIEERIDWLEGYWRNHPYDPETEGGTVGRILPENLHFYHAPNYVGELLRRQQEFFLFRNSMVLRFSDSPDDDLLRGYWEAYPILQSDHQETRRQFRHYVLRMPVEW